MEEDYNDDTWADHDEDCHGPVNTSENRANLPEAFIWQCCEKRGNEEGCETGPHMPGGSVGKKTRM